MGVCPAPMEAGLIYYAEQRARDLDIGYTHRTTPEALLSAVIDTEHQALVDIAPGEFPTECFGQYFGGYYDRHCALCAIQTACLGRFATGRLPDAEAQHKTQNPYDLARAVSTDELKVPPSAIALAQVYVDQLAGRAPAHEPYPFRLAHGRRRPVPDLESRRVKRLPWSEATRACMVAAQAVEASWPPPVPPASVWLGPTVAQSYAINRRFDGKRPKPTFGNTVWQRRHARERLRTPILKTLPPGTIMRRMWNNELIEVTVMPGFYVWRGYRYPTLYDAVGSIVGLRDYHRPINEGRVRGTRKMSNFSARRFFYQAFAQMERRIGITPTQRARTAVGTVNPGQNQTTPGAIKQPQKRQKSVTK